MALVTFSVGFDFRDPIRTIRPFDKFAPSLRPISAVPEITIAEHYDSLTSKNDVWSTWKVSSILSETKPPSPKSAPEHAFASRIG
jgi:hypothetical protein